MVKDYDCKIMYHPREANVVVDALIRKEVGAPINDICLRMIISYPLLDLIRKAQVERLKKANWKVERIRGQIFLFIKHCQGSLTQCGRVWVPTTSGVR